MKVFISWSGELSRELAEAVRLWLPGVLQAVQPYFTPDDIEKGARWSTDIAVELEDSKIGIFCITRENLNSSWIAFEAGAISKVVGKSAVCPILFSVENSDLSGPLGQFQTTSFDKKDFYKLVNTINDELTENKLLKETLKSVFEMWWPDLEKKINSIIDSHSKKQPEVLRSERDLLEEVLGLVRVMSKNDPSQIILGRKDSDKTTLWSKLQTTRAEEKDFYEKLNAIIHKGDNETKNDDDES